MALPADVSTRQVHGAWLGMDGNPRSGSVTFRPTAERLTNPSTSTVITGTTITAHLDTSGEITATLPCTDDPDLGGGPFSYLVTVELVGDEAPYAFWIDLPESEDVLELADVTPILPAEGGSNLVFSVNGESGHVTLSPADIGAEVSGAAATAVAAHVAAGDPHPQYLTAAEADFLPETGGTLTGSLTLASTFAGGEDTTDSTSRINLTSYQRNGDNSFGELIRLDLMPHDGIANAKGMLAWRAPRPVTDAEGTMRSVTWVGAHWASQDDPEVIHGHWSIETPDASDSLRTRFEILISNEAQTAIGSDKTLILTNQADFVVRTDNGQVLRLKTGAGATKPIEWSNSDWGGAGVRWQLRQNGTAETGSNAGSDLEVGRYNDSGVQQDTPFIITRSNGRITIGGTGGTGGGLLINRVSSGNAVTVDTYLSNAGANGTTALNHLAKDATSRTLNAQISTDSTARLVAFADGKIEWGPGNAGRDTNLYRDAADALRTDDDFRARSFTADGTVRSAFFKTTSSTAHAATIYQAGTSGVDVAAALNVVSDNPASSAMYLSGTETNRGTLKITHRAPAGGGADANAAALSIDLRQNGHGSTSAKAIFIESSDGGQSGQPLVQVRNGGGTDLFTIGSSGEVYTAASMGGVVTPAMRGLLGWTDRPNLVNSGTAVTNGVVYLAKVPIVRSGNVTKIYWHLNVSGVTPTAGQNWVALLNPTTGAKLAEVSIDGDITSTGLKTSTIASTAVAAPFATVAFLFNCATPPQIGRITGVSGAGALVNIGLTAANYDYATNGTTQTTIPGTVTLASNGQGIAVWAAVGP